MNFTKYFLLLAFSLTSLVFSSCDDDGEPLTRCDLPYDVGPCDAAIEKYYYDNELGTCRSFMWGGCEGVVPFETLGDCQESCMGGVEERCLLEPDAGPCEAYIPSYYYDASTGMCAEFIWGGCDGVRPFETLEMCLEACASEVDRCTLAPDPGDCEAAIPAYFVNQTNGLCTQFSWGGCGGVVPFETLEMCIDACGEPDPCTLEPHPGPCNAAIEAYYFDQFTGACASFTWGGCAGLVPFETMDLCLAACGSAIDPCSLIPDPGFCLAAIPAYYFDQDSQSCETFTWGGCGGVVPFTTMDLCLEACGSF